MLKASEHKTALAKPPALRAGWKEAKNCFVLQADFEPNSRKLRGHERIPAIYESEVCSSAHT